MENLLKQEALSHGDKLQVISIKSLKKLSEEIYQFKESEELNNFQKWIVNNLYKMDIPTIDFIIKSIIIIAIPHPAYAKVEFVSHGKKHDILSLVMSDFDNTEGYLKDFINSNNYHIQAAPNLPLKRLGVQSGLAVYGKNNVSYVEGMGSNFSYVAYFSDIPSENNEWHEIKQDDRCNHCNICLKKCPTGAIREERFLIDNERCLTYFNENPSEFPDWLPLSVHHCLYDCLKCQIYCPMNKDHIDNIIESIKFSEEETQLLLSGVSYDEFPTALKQKSKMLGLVEWLDAIPRNLKLLLEKDDAQDKITI